MINNRNSHEHLHARLNNTHTGAAVYGREPRRGGNRLPGLLGLLGHTLTLPNIPSNDCITRSHRLMWCVRRCSAWRGCCDNHAGNQNASTPKVQPQTRRAQLVAGSWWTEGQLRHRRIKSGKQRERVAEPSRLSSRSAPPMWPILSEGSSRKKCRFACCPIWRAQQCAGLDLASAG